MKRLRVGVLYGGRSGEHEVSLASAAAVWANLDRRRYEPVAIRIEKDGRWVLPDRPPTVASAADVIEQVRTDATRARGGREVFLPPRPGGATLVIVDRGSSRTEDADAAATLTGLALDVLFPVLHGPYGEDGTIQGLFELANIPYVGCGVLASSAGMDKAVMKVLFQARGLKVSDWLCVQRRDWRTSPAKVKAEIESRLTYPIFVKPANLGSSIGISKVHSATKLNAAMDLAATYDSKIVVEAAVPEAREIECAVLGNDQPQTSVPGEILPSREFYDYESKYLDNASSFEIPASISETDAATVSKWSIEAFEAIDGSGLARVDFLLSKTTGELYINEINSLPGFTTISMYPKMWEASGVAYQSLVDRLITLALERHAAKQESKTSAF